MSKYTEDFIKRFCSKFKQGGEEECWEWEAHKVKGYGQVWNGRKNLKAHRVSYELFVGPIPDGLIVRHKCDNPGCVNPHHLEVGTNADNMRDKVERERQPRGSGHGKSRLCESEVALIKKFFLRHPPVKGKHGGPCGFLARWFGVSQPTVVHINIQRTWTHINIKKD